VALSYFCSFFLYVLLVSLLSALVVNKTAYEQSAYSPVGPLDGCICRRDERLGHYTSTTNRSRRVKYTVQTLLKGGCAEKWDHPEALIGSLRDNREKRNRDFFKNFFNLFSYSAYTA